MVITDSRAAFINTKLCVACYKVRIGLSWPPADCGKVRNRNHVEKVRMLCSCK
jgi:hypothetical protein